MARWFTNVLSKILIQPTPILPTIMPAPRLGFQASIMANLTVIASEALSIPTALYIALVRRLTSLWFIGNQIARLLQQPLW